MMNTAARKIGRVKVAAMSLNVIAGDFDKAIMLHEQALDWMQRENVTIGVFPEMSLATYELQDAVRARFVQEEALENLQVILPKTKGKIIGVGLPVRYRGSTYNVIAVIVDGTLVGLKAKSRLASDGLHYESRTLTEWPEGQIAFHEELQVPIGDLEFSIGNPQQGYVLLKPKICEELWVAGGTTDLEGFAQRDGKMVLWHNASHVGAHKEDARRDRVVHAVSTLGLTVVSANWVGNQGGLGSVYDGSSFIWIPGQNPMRGRRASHRELEYTHAVIDVQQASDERAYTASFVPDVGQNPCCVKCEFSWPECSDRIGALSKFEAPWESSVNVEYEQAARCGGLGLLDYIRGSGSQGIALALSGGRDSVSVVLLTYLGVHEALEQLGIDGFRERYSHFLWLYDWKVLSETEDYQEQFGTRLWWIDLEHWEMAEFISSYRAKYGPIENLWDPAVQGTKDVMRRLLRCIYMQTSNSIVEEGQDEPTTLKAARAVCDETGAEFYVETIDEEVELEVAAQNRLRLMELRKNLASGRVDGASFGKGVACSLVSLSESEINKLSPKGAQEFAQALRCDLHWRFDEKGVQGRDNITLQNIQARVRGKRTENWANQHNLLVVPPSNLSELIIGYFTQGGDDSGGGPNPIASFFKSWLITMLEWWRDEGPMGLGRCRALEIVLGPPPSAELMPQQVKQTDEGELGSFVIRDFFARLLIKGYSPLMIFQAAREQDQFNDISNEDLSKLITQFFRKYVRNYWKLLRCCSGLHLGQENVAPESFHRSTPLNWMFERPLRRLQEYVANLQSST